MRIRSLRLINFRCHASRHDTFSDGVTGIRGPNGAGKSSLVEAMLFALYGKRALKGRHPRLHGSPQGEPCAVEFVFELDGRLFEVRRDYDGDVRLTIDGRLEAYTERQVSTTVAHHLKLDFKTFATAYIARQGDHDALLREGGEDRKKLVCGMLGITRIDKAHGDATTAANLLDVLAKGRARATQGLPAALAKRQEALDAAARLRREALAAGPAVAAAVHAAERAGGIATTLAAFRAASHELTDLAAEAKAATDKADEIARYRKRLTGRVALEREQQRLARERDRRAAEQSLEKARAKLKELRDQSRTQQGIVDRTTLAVQAAQKERTELERRRDERKRATDALAEAAAAYERAALGHDDEAKRAKARAQRFEKQRAELEGRGADAECPTCTVPLGGNYPRVIRQLRNETHTALLEASGAGDAAREARRERDAKTARAGQLADEAPSVAWIAARLTELDRLEAAARRDGATAGGRLVALRDDVAHWNSVEAEQLGIVGEGAIHDDPARIVAVDDALKQLDKVQWALDRALDDRAGMRDDDAITAAAAEAERVRADADAILVRLAPVERPDRDEMDADWWSEEADRLRADADEKAAAIAQKLQDANTADAVVLALKDGIEDMERQKQEQAAYEQAWERTSLLVTVLDRLRKELMAAARPTLQQYTSQLLRTMTREKYTRVALDDSFDLKLLGPDGLHVAETFSGGEYALAALCLRLAIARHVRETAGHHQSCLVLDEVFAAQDDDRRDMLRAQLREFAQIERAGHFGQVVVISHVPDVINGCDHVIEIDGADDGAVRTAEPLAVSV